MPLAQIVRTRSVGCYHHSLRTRVDPVAAGMNRMTDVDAACSYSSGASSRSESRRACLWWQKESHRLRSEEGYGAVSEEAGRLVKVDRRAMSPHRHQRLPSTGS